MTIRTLFDKPPIVTIVKVFCLILTAHLGFVFLINLSSSNITGSWMIFLELIIWVVTSIGILKQKKWGWSFFLGLLIFTILHVSNSIISMRAEVNFSKLLPIIMSIVMMLVLNRATVINAFKIEINQGKKVSKKLVNFAIFCMSGGLFLLIELFFYKINISSIPARLFVGILGLVFMLLGYGIWNLNRIAIKTVQPILIFTFLTVTFIFVADFLSEKTYFPLWQSIFYTSVTIGMVLYWRFYNRSETSEKI